MKPVTMFVTSWCPYCKKALVMMQELQSENSAFANIEINVVDEELEPDKSKNFDYYYVPTYYIGTEKIHEGAASKDIISRVFNKAMLD
jgi:thioredoxin 1